MPTGYTAKLVEGEQTFTEFALQCARAFGALIHMRDAPLSSEIVPATKNLYHVERIKQIQRELVELETVSDKALDARQESERRQELQNAHQYLARMREENNRLNNMIKRVLAWSPPTEVHQNFKEFMLKQLKISLNDTLYTEQQIKELQKTVPTEKYRESRKYVLKRDLKYHKQMDAEEEARVNERNQWLTQLRDSLG